VLLFVFLERRFRSSNSLFADKAVKEPQARDPHRLNSTQFSGEALPGLLLSANET